MLTIYLVFFHYCNFSDKCFIYYFIMGRIYNLKCTDCNLDKPYDNDVDRVVRAYVSENHDVFRLGYQLGYCRSCDDIRNIETLADPIDHSIKISALELRLNQALSESRKLKFRDIFVRVFGINQSNNHVAFIQAELVQATMYKQKCDDFYRFTQGRQKRCLSCSSAECIALAELDISNEEDETRGKHKNHSYTALHIGCGGKLTLKPTDEYTTWMSAPTSYLFYDKDGIPIPISFVDMLDEDSLYSKLLNLIRRNDFF